MTRIDELRAAGLAATLGACALMLAPATRAEDFNVVNLVSDGSVAATSSSERPDQVPHHQGMHTGDPELMERSRGKQSDSPT